jgi:hypothetical protein
LHPQRIPGPEIARFPSSTGVSGMSSEHLIPCQCFSSSAKLTIFTISVTESISNEDLAVLAHTDAFPDTLDKKRQFDFCLTPNFQVSGVFNLQFIDI